MKKRILSLLLAFVLCVGMLPAAALAAEGETGGAVVEDVPVAPSVPSEDGEEGGATPEVPEVNVIDSGDCGDNLTWTVTEFADESGDSRYRLTITGTGAMYDYEIEEPGWYIHRGETRSLALPEGMTAIGSCAFYDFDALTEVVIPDSVTHIGMNAFNGCGSLANLELGSGVEVIDTNAFKLCVALTELAIPDSVTEIWPSAFESCTALECVTLGSSVRTIGNYAFLNCESLNGVVIPDSVTSIGGSAFEYCYNLETVTLGSGVETIGDGAFGKTALTEVVIPDGVNYIGYWAFWDCKQLETVTLGNSVAAIEDNAFSGCGGLGAVTFKGDAPTFGASTFSGVTATCYYPADAAGWADLMKAEDNQFGGTLTWVASGGETPEVPGEEGGEAPVSLSVTDLHFAPLGSGTLPYLYWKAPAGVEGELRYNVYASVDQKNWVWVSSTSQELISLTGLDAAVYCAFKVETEVNDVVVAEAVSGLTLTVTQGADLPAASVVFAQPETTGGDYPITVSGLTPNTWVTFSLKRGTGGGSTSGSTSDADGKYFDSESNENMKRYQDDKASVYLVREFSNTEISEDGLSASYTVSNRGGWASVAAAVVGGATGEEGGEGETTGYTLNFVYDDDLCDFSAMDWYTDEPVENGGILPINVEKNSAYGQFSISNIADGYRIASVFVNDKDRSSTFIGGAYGGCALTISEDSTITVTLEPIPEVLPDIASVAIYTGQMADKSSVLAETVTFGETLSGLHAEILFADKGSYPSYYAACDWQYSTDGKIWNDLYVWGTRTDFNAAWSGFANTIKVDFMTLENYQLRVMVTPKEYYSTAGEADCIYSAPVLVNPTTGEGGGEVPEVPEVTVTASGTYGDGLTWVLTSDGVLTISGDGAISGTSASGYPWNTYASAITKAVLEEGITAIGDWAFYYCSAMESVSLPDSLTTINYGAFCFCSALTEVTIPANVILVNSNGFSQCTGLKTVTFLGDAPAFNTTMNSGVDAFLNVTATCYYPADNESWTKFLASGETQYGGTLTWKAIGSDDGETEAPVLPAACLTRAEACVAIVDAMGWAYSADMTVPFTDVPAAHEAYEAIAVMYDRGIVSGANEDGTLFEPDSGLTRGQSARLLCLVLGKDGVVDEAIRPTDVPAASWTAGYICTVLSEGLMSVDASNNFDPSAYTQEGDVDFDKLAQIAGGETEALVSNLRFVIGYDGLPCLCWDISPDTESGMWYYVYASTDAGSTWSMAGGEMGNTRILRMLDAGQYNAFKVEARLSGEVLGTCISTDLTLTVTEQTAEKPAKVSIAEPEIEGDSYTVSITGLTPGVYFKLNIENSEENSEISTMCDANGCYTTSESYSLMTRYLDDETTICWVNECINGAVNGTTASFTLVNHGESLLKDVMAKPVELAAPTDVKWGTYYYSVFDYENDASILASETYPGMISWVIAAAEYDHSYEINVFKKSTDSTVDDEMICSSTWKYKIGMDTRCTDHDFSLSLLEKYGSGTYYFTVQAKGNGKTTADSVIVTSDEWVYAVPDTQLPAPTDLTWDGTTIMWNEAETETAAAKVGGYLVQIYFAESEDALQDTWKKADSFVCYTCEKVMTSYTLRSWMLEKYGTGYYYARVKAVSADPNAAKHSDFTEFSEPYYYSNLVTVNTQITGEGEIILENAEVVQGRHMAFSVKPALGYKLSSLYYVVGEQDACYMDAKYNGSYGLVPTESEVTIYAAFEPLSEISDLLGTTAFSIYQSTWSSPVRDDLVYGHINTTSYDTAFVRLVLIDGDGKQVLAQEGHRNYTWMNLINPGDLEAGQYTAYITVGDASQILPLGWCTVTLADAYSYDANFNDFNGQLATGASSITVNVNVQKLSPVSLPDDLTLSLTDKNGKVYASSDEFRIVYNGKNGKNATDTAVAGKEATGYVNTGSSLKFTLDLTGAGLTTDVGYYLTLTAADGTQFINANSYEIWATNAPVFCNQSFDFDTMTWTADCANLPAGSYELYQESWYWDSTLNQSVMEKIYYETMTVSADGTAAIVFGYWPFESENGGGLWRTIDCNGTSWGFSVDYWMQSSSSGTKHVWHQQEIENSFYVNYYDNYSSFAYAIPYDGSTTQFVTVTTPYSGSGFYEVYEPNGSLMISCGVEDLSSFQFTLFDVVIGSTYRVSISADDESVFFDDARFQFRCDALLGIDWGFSGSISGDTVTVYPSVAVTEDTFKIGYLNCGEKVELPFTVNEDGSVSVTVSSIPCGQWKPWATVQMQDKSSKELYDEPMLVGGWFFRVPSKLSATSVTKVAKLVPTVGSGYLFSAPVVYEGTAPTSDVTMTVFKMDDGALTYHTAVNIGTGEYTISESKLNLAGEYVFYFTLADGPVLDVETAAFGDESVEAKGNCGQVTEEYPEGENLFWTLDDEGVLTIFGKGEMGTSDLAPESYKYPWDAHEDAVKKVVIKEGVTSLGAYAFNGYENLTSVDLAGSIGSGFSPVGGYAFASCPKLTHVTLREGYRVVTSGMFEYCTSLTTVVFPSTLKTFSDTSFRGSGLKTVAFRGGSVNSEVSWEKILSDTSGLTLFYPINSDWDETEMNKIAPDGSWVKMQKVPNLQPDAFDATADTATIQAVVDAVSGTAAKIMADNYDFYGVREQLLTANNVEDTTNAVVNVYVDVTLEKYAIDAKQKTLTLDITPKAQLVVNGERTGVPTEIEVWDEITVTIPLPADFAEVGEQMKIVHTKDDGKKIVYDVTVQQDDEGGLYVQFENCDGFSTFAVIGEASDPALKVGNIRYEMDEMGQLIVRWDFPANVEEGEYEYHVYFLPDGETGWYMECSTEDNTCWLSAMSAGKYTAVKVETHLPGDEKGPGALLASVTEQIALTVSENEKTTYDPAEVTVIRESETADAYVISMTGLQPNTSTKVTFRKCWYDEKGFCVDMEETTHGWYADDNGTIYFNERDDWFTQWLSAGLDDETCTVLYFLQENGNTLHDDGSASILLTSYGGWTEMNCYLEGDPALMDPAYTVSDVKFYENPNDDGDLPVLTWTAPEDVSGWLDYVVYFYTENAIVAGIDKETGEEIVSIDWDMWTARFEADGNTELDLIELAEKSNEYIAIKVVTRADGITRAEYTSALHSVSTQNGAPGADETAPGVTVYRVSEDKDGYTIKITGLKEETNYVFRLWNDYGWEGRNSWFNGDESVNSFNMGGEWITEAFADSTDDNHIHYSLKEVEAILSEDADSGAQHVDVTSIELVYAYDPMYEEVPTYAPEEVEATNIRFTVEDGVPYLRWDAPEKALDGLTYHVMFDFKNADGEDDCRGWPVDGLKTELHDMEPAEYTAIRVITELDGMTVAEVKADVTLTVGETDDLKAKLMIQKEADGDVLFLFSGLTANSEFRFEGIQEKGNPDGPSFNNGMRADANGACENGNGSWFMEEYGNGEYRIVETAAALDENGNLTISNRSTGWKNIQDAIAVPAAPKTEDITISEKLELNEEQAGEVTDAAANVTVDLVHENVKIDTEGMTDKETGEEIDTTREDISVKTEVALKIEVTDYQVPVEDEETGEIVGDTTKMVLDITPVATVTVSKETVNEETGETESEPIATKTGAEVDTTGTPVVVTIPLPRNFLNAAGWTLYVVHTKDDGSEFTHRVEVQGDDESGYFISFVNTEGFSTFTVTGEAVALTYKDGDGKEQTEIYDGLWNALNSARDRANEDCTGVTVKLLLDGLEEGQLFVTNGVTLDLNGKTLNAGYVAAFNGSHIVDNSAEKTGVLKVEKTNIMLSKDNGQMPVWNGVDGYVFETVDFSALIVDTKVAGTYKITFKPRFSQTVMSTLLNNGAADNNLEFVVRLSWEGANGTVYQDLVYTDEMVRQVYSGKAFVFSVSSYESFAGLSASVVVASGTYVEVVSAEYAITAPSGT